jgi:probable O-glycosylation ligase (exosortase A-associated)
MRDALLIIFVFSALPVILLRPYIGLYIWAWLGYMNPHRLTWGFAYDFAFVQLVAIVTIIGIFFSREEKHVPWSTTIFMWLTFIGWMTLTTIFSLDPDGAYEEWIRVIKIQTMIAVTLLLINSPSRVKGLIWVIVISIGFYGIKGGIFTLLSGGQYRVWGPPESFIEGNNEIALALVIVLPLMRYLQTITANIWIKIGFLAAMALSVASILSSYSRGAFLALIAMAIALLLKSKQKLVIGVILIVLGLGAIYMMPTQWHNRIETIETYEKDSSAMGRLNAWLFAINLTKDYPVMGGGFQTFRKDLFEKYAPVPEDFHDSHSIYFEVLAEQGYVGMLIFLIIGFLVIKNCQYIVSKTKDNYELKWATDLAAMVQVSLVGYAIGGAFLGLAYFDLPYHLIAVIVITRNIVQRSLNEAESYKVISFSNSTGARAVISNYSEH